MELVCIPGTDDTTVKLITFLFWHAAPLLAPGSQYLSLVQLHYITFHFRELFTKQPQAIDIYYWHKSIMINPAPNGGLSVVHVTFSYEPYALEVQHITLQLCINTGVIYITC